LAPCKTRGFCTPQRSTHEEFKIAKRCTPTPYEFGLEKLKSKTL
jgi:hypothetical protein